MRKAYLEVADAQKMEMAADNTMDRLLIRLLFHLGYRVSEAIAITREHINLERGTVTIQHLKARLSLVCPECNARLGKSHVFYPRCGKKVDEAKIQSMEHRRQRELPVDSDTLAMLKEYIELGRQGLRDGEKPILSINRHRAWQIVKECAQKAGLPKLVNPETGRVHNVSPHKLRDAFAVMAVKHNDSGDGLRLLQEHLGHQSFNTTARYRKIAGDEHRRWYERLWSEGSRELDCSDKQLE